jgi:hypothetical protein
METALDMEEAGCAAGSGAGDIPVPELAIVVDGGKL